MAGRGQLDEAVAHYRRALTIEPDYAEAHNNLGTALAGRGELDEAVEHFRNALKIKPELEMAGRNLAVVVSQRDRLLEKTAPRAWQDEVVYVVIVQKFCNGDPANDVMRKRFGKQRRRYEGGFWGGDLQGVIQKMDYLSSLGVTALLLYPVMANDAEPLGKYLATGYRPRDYFRVDENFGDMPTLKRLVDLAHRRRMRVILDLPLGMPGLEHPYCRDAGKRDWFGPMTHYGVRQWNAEKPEVASYLIEISRFWKEQTGCDGFRLDSAHLHSQRFWRQYGRALRPPQGDDFFLLAELPLPPRQIGSFLAATGLPSAYDFSIGIVRDVFGNGAGLGRLSFVLREGQQFYPTPPQMCAQIDNYEAPDFLTAAAQPRPLRLKLAMTFLLTLDRIPLLYSGDEAALSYQDVGGLFDPSRANPAALDYARTLIALRKKEAALRRGDLVVLQTPEPIFAFLRSYGNERLLVVLNHSPQRRAAAFALGGDAWKSLELFDLLSRRSVKPRASDAPLEIEAWDARIFRVLK